jgi:hypothetical protein
VPVDPLPAMPAQEPERNAEAVRRALPDLLRLSRYESRARARRDDREESMVILYSLKLQMVLFAKRTQFLVVFSSAFG